MKIIHFHCFCSYIYILIFSYINYFVLNTNFNHGLYCLMPELLFLQKLNVAQGFEISTPFHGVMNSGLWFYFYLCDSLGFFFKKAWFWMLFEFSQKTGHFRVMFFWNIVEHDKLIFSELSTGAHILFFITNPI